MEPWYSGAVGDAVREAKTRGAVLIVYVRENSEQSHLTDQLWSKCWVQFPDTSRIVALRLDKDTQPCTQFMAIYKVQKYPTIYFINGQNGQVLKLIEEPSAEGDQIEQTLKETLNLSNPPQTTTTESEAAAKTIEDKVKFELLIRFNHFIYNKFKVAEARARLKELQERREEEAKEKEREDEIARRRLGQQMLLDKQKKEEDQLRQRAEEIRRDRLEQQKLQEKLKAQIQQDREEKRRKYEDGQSSAVAAKITATTTVTQPEIPKANYTRSRLQFRLTDGSFFTEDFSLDATMADVYSYLHQTLPSSQYSRNSFVLRTTHTRVTLLSDNPSTLKELELVPSAVLLVIARGGNALSNTSANNFSSNSIFQPVAWIFIWFMIQFNFLYQFLSRTLFGGRPTTARPVSTTSPTTMNRQTSPPKASPRTKEVFRNDPSETSTIRRFRNTQDDKDEDDDDKRTWNGNSTQQL